MKQLLFLCTGNSCRSQMAEGWARELLGGSFSVESAGVEIHGMNQNAVRVMAEVGIDLQLQRSQHIDEFDLKKFDYIVTVCDHAHESCPVVPAECRILHKSFDDPPRLAGMAATEEEKIECYRKVRDQIRAFIVELPKILAKRDNRYES